MDGRIDFDNGDYYIGEISGAEPDGFGTYFIPSLGLSFEATWTKEEGPDFASMKVTNEGNGRFVLLFERSEAVYRHCYFKALFAPKAGEVAYEDMHPLFDLLHPSDRKINVLEVGEDSVTFEVPGLFNEDSASSVDTVRLGESSIHEDRFENGCVFADDYVEYTEHYRLELHLV